MNQPKRTELDLDQTLDKYEDTDLMEATKNDNALTTYDPESVIEWFF